MRASSQVRGERADGLELEEQRQRQRHARAALQPLDQIDGLERVEPERKKWRVERHSLGRPAQSLGHQGVQCGLDDRRRTTDDG